MKPQEMAEKFMDYMDKEEIKYEFIPDAERPRIKTGFSLKCKLRSVSINYLFAADGCSCVGSVPLKADDATRVAVMEYITRANFGMRNGCFEMDMRDGEVRFRTFMHLRYEDINGLEEDTIMEYLYIMTSILDRYGDGLCAIMMGFSDPATEIAKAES